MCHSGFARHVEASFREKLTGKNNIKASFRKCNNVKKVKASFREKSNEREFKASFRKCSNVKNI